MSLKKYKSLIEKQEEIKKQLKEIGPEAIKEIFKPYFKKHSKLKSIKLYGFAPYFNDGDPCVFHIREYMTKIISKNGNVIGEESDTEDEEGFIKELKLSEEETNSLWSEISSEVGKLDEDLCEYLFGDSFEVTIYKDRIEIDSYSAPY